MTINQFILKFEDDFYDLKRDCPQAYEIALILAIANYVMTTSKIVLETYRNADFKHSTNQEEVK